MTAILSIISFFGGASFASFWCQQVFRSQEKRKGISSSCDHCKKKLQWFELVPLFGYISQKGRCRHCKGKIPSKYFLAEISNGLLAFLVFYLFTQYPLTENSSLISILLILSLFESQFGLTLYDITFQKIPRYLLILIFILISLILPFQATTLSMIINNIVGASTIFMLFGIIKFIVPSHLKFSDLLFATSIGLFLGLYGGLLAITIGSICLGISHVFTKYFKKTHHPLIPYLFLGEIIIWSLKIIA